MTGSSDNCDALDTDMTSIDDSIAATEYSSQSDQDSDAELSDSADSCVVTSRRKQPPPARDRTSQTIVRFVLCHGGVLLHDALCCCQWYLLNLSVSVAGAISGLELDSVSVFVLEFCLP